MTARYDLTAALLPLIGGTYTARDTVPAVADAVLEHLTRAGWLPPRAGEDTTAPEHMSMMECGHRGHRWTDAGYCSRCDAAVWPNARAESPAQPGEPDLCLLHNWEPVTVTTTSFDDEPDRTEVAYFRCTECRIIADTPA